MHAPLEASRAPIKSVYRTVLPCLLEQCCAWGRPVHAMVRPFSLSGFHRMRRRLLQEGEIIAFAFGTAGQEGVSANSLSTATTTLPRLRFRQMEEYWRQPRV